MNRESIRFLKENGYFLFPQMLQFEITRRCPFHCPQCYKKSLDNLDIDYKYLSDMIELAVENEVSLLTLNGGEPLLFPRICDLLTRVGETNILTNIFSSGFNLTEDILHILKKYENLSFYVSLNGSTKEINGLSRDGYDISISAIEKLKNNDIRFGINWVARHDNVKDFPKMLALCLAHGVSFISVTSSKLTGSGDIQSPLDSNDLCLLSDYINYRSDPMPSILIESCFSMLSTRIIGNKNSFSAHCYAGVSSCTVNCNNTFQPCTHLKFPERYESIEAYWHKSPILSKLRSSPPNTLNPCRNCKHNKICSLCRAMSVETYTDLRAGASSCLNYV